MTLPELRLAADDAEAAFHKACRAAGYVDHWSAYRGEDKGDTWPSELLAAHECYMARVHAFYLARDGAAGVLGSRGL